MNQFDVEQVLMFSLMLAKKEIERKDEIIYDKEKRFRELADRYEKLQDNRENIEMLLCKAEKLIAELESEREKVRILVDAIHNDYDDIPCVEGCHMESCDCARGDIAERLLELSKILDRQQDKE